MTPAGDRLVALLRKSLNKGVLAPGCYDALSATLIEQAGFDAAYLSGASLSYSRLGVADIGLVTATEVETAIGQITDRIDIPLIVDADTGFGNAINVSHTIRRFERAGASAIQLEDQQAPKRCGHLKGKALIASQEMAGKIRAATDSRHNALIIARTDAIAVEGIEKALERANAYAEAGADILFVEAPRSIEEMADIARQLKDKAPLVANMVEGGSTPLQPFDELVAQGYRLVLFPGSFARAIVFMAREMLGILRRDGSTEAYRARMVDLSAINDVVGAAATLEMGRRYSADIGLGGVDRRGKS